MGEDRRSFDEACRELGITEGDLEKLVAEGEIASIREGDRLYFKKEQIARLRNREPSIILDDTDMEEIDLLRDDDVEPLSSEDFAGKQETMDLLCDDSEPLSDSAGKQGSAEKGEAIENDLENESRKAIRVFISAKSDDAEHAERVYRFLESKGITAFFGPRTLKQLGKAEYQKEIDQAIEDAEHMIVVASSAANAKSPWVESEWRLFINEKRSYRKKGNLLTIVAGDLKAAELPPSLRYFEVIQLDPNGLVDLLAYMR